MTYQTLTFEIEDGVATVTMNRPEAGNSLSLDLANDLMRVAIECDENPAVRAVILTGAGKHFCFGGDLKSFHSAGDNAAPLVKELAYIFHGAISRFCRMDAPLINAVNGTAAGAGFSFALIGDIVLCGLSSKFTMAYTANGLSPDGSSSYFLPRLVGLRKAQELMLLNPLLTADEAKEIGLVTKVVADEDLLTEARSIADGLAKGATKAYGRAKRLLVTSFNESLETQMEFESRAIADSARSADGREGIDAFINKRKPVFKGE